MSHEILDDNEKIVNFNILNGFKILEVMCGYKPGPIVTRLEGPKRLIVKHKVCTSLGTPLLWKYLQDEGFSDRKWFKYGISKDYVGEDSSDAE